MAQGGTRAGPQGPGQPAAARRRPAGAGALAGDAGPGRAARARGAEGVAGRRAGRLGEAVGRSRRAAPQKRVKAGGPSAPRSPAVARSTPKGKREIMNERDDEDHREAFTEKHPVRRPPRREPEEDEDRKSAKLRPSWLICLILVSLLVATHLMWLLEERTPSERTAMTAIAAF